MMSATSYAALSVAVIGLFGQPQLSSMPATSLPLTIGHSSSGSSMLLQLSSPRWQRPLTTVAPGVAPPLVQARAVAPQAPPVPQLALLTHWLAMQVPPPVQMLAVPGAVQVAPALPELAEHRPGVVPAVQPLPHSSSVSSMVRQPPPGHCESRTHDRPGTLERKSQVPLPSSSMFEKPPRLSSPPAS